MGLCFFIDLFASVKCMEFSTSLNFPIKMNIWKALKSQIFYNKKPFIEILNTCRYFVFNFGNKIFLFGLINENFWVKNFFSSKSHQLKLMLRWFKNCFNLKKILCTSIIYKINKISWH